MACAGVAGHAEAQTAPEQPGEENPLGEGAEDAPGSGAAPEQNDGEITQEEYLEQEVIRAEEYDTFPAMAPPGPAEPNFLPPFANAENKALNKTVRVMH